MNKFDSLSKSSRGYEFSYLYGSCDRGHEPPGNIYDVVGVVRSRFLILAILKGWYRMLFYNEWECNKNERKVSK